MDICMDEVCESCGQIFSARAALLEHRARKTCCTARQPIPVGVGEAVGTEQKRLHCPYEGCSYTFATQSGLGKHKTKIHGHPKRGRGRRDPPCDIRSGVSHQPCENSTKSLALTCPFDGCAFTATKGKTKHQMQISLWSHITRQHPGSNIDVFGGPFRCTLYNCGWSGFSENERDLHERIYHMHEQQKPLLQEVKLGVKRASDGGEALLVAPAKHSTVQGRIYPNKLGRPEEISANSSFQGKSQFEGDYDRICSVIGCRISQKMLKPNGERYEFFSFPKNSVRLARWTKVANPRFPDFCPKATDAICERHFRKADLLCAKPGLMDGADPHCDDSLDEDDSNGSENAQYKAYTADSGPSSVQRDRLAGDHTATFSSFSAVDTSATTNEKNFRLSALEDSDGDGDSTANMCCGSEIPVMRRRVRHMEKQCDSLFHMIRGLLQATHAQQLANGASAASEMWKRRQQEEKTCAVEEAEFEECHDALKELEARQIELLRAASAQYAERLAARDASSTGSVNRNNEAANTGTKSSNPSTVNIRTENAHSLEALTDSDLEACCFEQGEEDENMAVSGAGSQHAKESDQGQTTSKRMQKRRLKRSCRAPGEPRLDLDNLILLHPLEDRPLEKDEVCYYLSRVILMLQTNAVTKSRVRMLGPEWVQVLDDSDIITAIEELKRTGLLYVDENRKARNQNIKVFLWASPVNVEDFETWMAYYRVPEAAYMSHFDD